MEVDEKLEDFLVSKRKIRVFILQECEERIIE